MFADAFGHLPHLRDKVTPPERSELRITPAVLAFWDERARGLGRPPDWRLSDKELEDSRSAVLDTLDAGQDLWVFSYGSLMWDPGFHFAEVRLAELEGYKRRFTFKTEIGRGSPERPGLMLSLERCLGNCKGLAFRIPSAIAEVESAVVWRREMIRGSYRPALMPVGTAQGEVMALTFASNPAHPSYVGELPLAETAALIASGSGLLGTNRQYLEQLAAQLQRLVIEDAYIDRLVKHVQLLADDRTAQ